MTNAMSDATQYCKELVKKLNYECYLQCAFAPELYPFFALDAELRHVHHAVSEEMIGHIRYAWWAETVVAMDKKHPVIEAIAALNIPKETLLELVECYRAAYPELPKTADEILDSIVQQHGNARAEKAGRIIANHKGGRLRLLAKLLVV